MPQGTEPERKNWPTVSALQVWLPRGGPGGQAGMGEPIYNGL